MIPDKLIIEKLAEQYDSFYLYEEKKILEGMQTLQSHFPLVSFLYSLKCNSNPHVLECVFANGFGADAASAGEVMLARENGVKKDSVFYSAPGKTIKDIENTINSAVIIADSIDEIRRIQSVAEKMHITTDIGIRVNPSFSFYGKKGLPSKFGIDEDQVLAFLQRNECANVRIKGIHVHLRSQELNTKVLSVYYDNILLLVERMQKTIPDPVEWINMGSGMGIPYSVNEKPLAVEELGKHVNASLVSFRKAFPNVRIYIETGRYVVGKAGRYVTKVIDRKLSQGKTFIILKNTMNGFVRPSLARLVAHYSTETSPAGSEPFFSGADAFQFIALKEGKCNEYVTLAGNLCTATDVIAENILMPHLEYGDLVVVSNAGAYAAVLSPMQFSLQERPAELFVTKDGKVL